LTKEGEKFKRTVFVLDRIEGEINCCLEKWLSRMEEA
jgi:hypothetical protein